MTDLRVAELEEKREQQEVHIPPEAEFLSPESLFEELVSKIKSYHPSTDLSMVEKAYRIADQLHKGQMRKSGEAYIIHPLCVAIILAELELDKETIVAGILHDVLEDTAMTDMELARDFGMEIVILVDGVTKLGQLPYDADKVELEAENLRKMFLAMAKDIRVILIKLADRLHNMRTLKYMRPDQQKEKARETMDIYAPIAQRLGISTVKSELEDLSLKYLEPEAYYDLVREIGLQKGARAEYIDELVEEVRVLMESAGIAASVVGRAKHFFSIYRKMVNQDKGLDQLFDLFAIRIIVNTVKDCYEVLGIIHEIYKPIPGRFKDYIAMPKPNDYQSLHTTLIGPSGQPFEIQIRTFEMHRIAEYGIAAHWKYKESSDGRTISRDQEEAKLTWLRQILELQREMSDNREFLDLLKSDLDLFSEMVFCFTPQGDVKNLPAGSTPVDFAYGIHSAIGNKMIGAKVNDKLVPIDYKIKNGDRIEILTSQHSKGPSRDWLNLVKSAQAKNKILQFFRTQYKEEDIAKGKDLLLAYSKGKGLNLHELNKPEYQQRLMKRYGFRDWDSLLAAVGRGALKEGQIINKLSDYYREEHQETPTDGAVLEKFSLRAFFAKDRQLRKKKPGSGILVSGEENMNIRLSRCCSPIPGDDIVGFVTRGRGVSIHRRDCSNVTHLTEDEKVRILEASWAALEQETPNYDAEIQIFGHDRAGLLLDLTKIFTERKINILRVNSSTSKQGIATISIFFSTKGGEEVGQLIGRVRQVEGVIDIKRSAGG